MKLAGVIDAAEGACREVPQLEQKCSPGVLCLPQLEQKVVAGAADPLAVGTAVSCTGVPHSGQNFLPVTSLPQDVHVAMILDSCICMIRTKSLSSS
jgi:hypothetical protein